MHQHTPFAHPLHRASPASIGQTSSSQESIRVAPRLPASGTVLRPTNIAPASHTVTNPDPLAHIEPWPRALRIAVLVVGGCLGWVAPIALYQAAQLLG